MRWARSSRPPPTLRRTARTPPPPDTSTATTFAWWDGAVAASTSFDGDTNSTSSQINTSTFSYDGFGTATSVSIADGRARTVTITNDLNGQAVRRDEADALSGGDPHEIWYRFGGKQLGYNGNDGTLETSYDASIANRQKTTGTGAFRFGAANGAGFADFDQGVAPFTSYAQGGSGGSYTVRTGDTLNADHASRCLARSNAGKRRWRVRALGAALP